MDYLKPIYTEITECQDCYKCLRQCTVKAIKIQEGHATIMPELCIMCGHCVQACPVGAKRVRDDLERAKRLLQLKEKVIVSLAPSFISEFNNVDPAHMIAALKKLGFFGVSETALGTQEVSAHVGQLLNQKPNQIFISSACPTVVQMIKKYQPQYAGNIVNLLSPVLAHSKMLRQHYGEDIGVVFIGPCISKKFEADSHDTILDVALTFETLRRWFKEEGVDPNNLSPNPDDQFVPHTAHEGALYPIDGGMIAGIKANCTVKDAQFMAFSGIDNIRKVLADLERVKPDGPIFIEMLACEGGCVNGPRTADRDGTIAKRHDVITFSEYPNADIPRQPQINIDETWPIGPVKQAKHSEADIKQALNTVGKFSSDDELNCGASGYDSCREFAQALLDGRAEQNMCVSYMRKLAHQKADALIRTMPSGVVIVDEKLQIVECNRRFAEILGDETKLVYEARPGMEGARLEKVVPFHKYFSEVLSIGSELIEKDVKIEHIVLHLTVFTIEPHRLVGGIIQDITLPAVQKERIVNQAREVITRNLATVQQIAYLLGENAADSEVILNSIISSFSPESIKRSDASFSRGDSDE